RYGDLHVRDARGRSLQSWLALNGGAVLLRVDTHGAHYPLRIDPFVQQAKLTGVSEEVSNSKLGAKFGFSVALSGDGNTALVGGPGGKGGLGAAWVFTREGTTWSEQATLTGNEEIGGGELGRWGVALSFDGNTALVGGPSDNAKVGAAWVFAREGTTWSQQAKLTGNEEIGAGRFGFGVALPLTATPR